MLCGLRSVCGFGAAPAWFVLQGARAKQPIPLYHQLHWGGPCHSQLTTVDTMRPVSQIASGPSMLCQPHCCW